MYKPFKALFFFSCLAVGLQVQAQQHSNSPYSRFGVGDVLHGTGNVRNQAMGQTGVSTASGGVINDVNPALLYYNRRVIFEASVDGELKKLADSQTSQVDASGNLGSLGLAIPINNYWTAAVGLKPYSRVSYVSFLRSSIAGAPDVTALTEYKGTGGLNEVYFAHGVRVAKGLTLGLTGSFLFGTIDREAATLIVDSKDSVTVPSKVVVHTNSKYSGALLTGGAYYWTRVSPRYILGFGAKYTAQATISADRQQSQERRLLDETLTAKILTDSAGGYTTLPQSLQAGFTIESNKNWLASAEYTMFKGSDFRGFSEEKKAGRQELGNGYRIGLGGEFTPDPASVSSYFKRVAYRVGGYYRNSEIITASGANNLKDMGVTWGFIFPLGRGLRPPDYTQALLNTSFAVGMQEAAGTGLKEQYVRMTIGFAFTNQWFIKRRFD